MNVEEFREFCLSLPDTTEGFPFGLDVLVFKVRGKMFCLSRIDGFESINVKCDPEKAIELRERYPEVTPGYHMNKSHWNTVNMHGEITDDLIREWITDSYRIIVGSLPKKDRAGLENI